MATAHRPPPLSPLAPRRPPRDLRLGIVSFASVPAGALWRDEDVVRIVRSGLAGTGMRAWTDISDDDLARIEKELEKITHEVVAEIDTLVGHKEKELLSV